MEQQVPLSTLGLTNSGLGEAFQFQPSMILVTRAFRGYWLVQSLLKKGWKITVLNWPLTSGQFLSDFDGPFPLLAGTQITPEMMQTYQSVCLPQVAERLQEDPSSFQILMDDGPMFFEGALGAHHLQSRGIQGEILAELNADKPVKAGLKRIAYQEVWPHLLARQIAALEDFSQVRAFGRGRPLSIGHRLSLRELDAETENKMWMELRDAGGNFDYHTIVPNESELGIKSSRGWVDGIVWQDRAFQARGVCWALSAEESVGICGRSSWTGLFEEPYQAWQNAKAVWMAAVGEIKADQVVLDGLPNWFAVVQDIDLPWRNENFVVVRQNFEKPGWTFWVKVPMDVSAATERQEEIWKRCQGLIEARIPDCQVTRLPAFKIRFGARVDDAKSRGREAIGKNYILIGPDRWANWSGEDAMIWEAKALEQMNSFNRNWEAEAQRIYRARQKELEREERARVRALQKQEERRQKEITRLAGEKNQERKKERSPNG